MAGDEHEERLKAKAAARLGSVLRGKWRLDSVLGAGGMASVYASTHRNGSRAAVKVLHPELCRDAEVQRRFLREGYVANAVGHPGAVRVLDDDVTDDGAVFIVMELLEGETLETRRNRLGGKLPPAEAILFGAQLLDVLAAAHDKGIVHRDVKTENVVVTTDGRVMLLDFGIAKAREVAQGQGLSMATKTGATMGTPAFMPPEQALGLTDEIDGQSDIWSVGATLFTLLAGRLVHEARTMNELLVATASKPARPLASVAPEVPQPLAAVVDRALAFERRARWPDARAMARALREARGRLGLPEHPFISVHAAGAGVSAFTLPSAATVPLATSAPRRRWGAALAAAGAVAITVALVGLAFELRVRRAAPAGPTAASEPFSLGETPKPPPQALPERAPAAIAPAATSAPVPVVTAAVEAPPASAPASSSAAPAGVRRTEPPKASGVTAKPRPAAPSDQDLLDRQH